jgi:hypothetical protein
LLDYWTCFLANFFERHLFVTDMPCSFISKSGAAGQEAWYTAWLQAKVAASLADLRPVIAHDEVMAEMDALINQIARSSSTTPG